MRRRKRIETKHLRSCVNDSEDHNRLPVPRSHFKALAGSSTHERLAQRLDSFVRRQWSLMHTSGSRSAFRAGLPFAPTTQIGLFCAGPW